MVDYDTAVQIVQDENADPVDLAKIAYENPDFGAVVAANPRAYPGLKRWLAQFGDDQARAELHRQGFPMEGSPVRKRPLAQQPASSTNGPDRQDAAAQAGEPHARQADRTDDAPAATNSHGYTVEQALDPNTDQMTIAQIAQYAPELRPYLARNPNTYPALLQWLADLHDPEIDAALVTRRQG